MQIHLLFNRVKTSILITLAILLSSAPGWAQVTTNWFYYAGNQSGSPGTNWSGSNTTVSAYWTNVFGGVASQPTNGTVTATTTNYNFYMLTNNGTQIGNGTTVTLIRPPYSSPAPGVVTFPGDTLILQTNTMIRFKNLSTTGTLVTGVPYATPTNNFPGNFGLPGIQLNGGALNNGTTGDAAIIQGSIYAVPGSQSYLIPADTLNEDAVLRSLVVQAQLTGSGTIVLLNGDSEPAGTAPAPQPFIGTSNNFTGEWIVKSGWLQGAGDGTPDGYNSLGTNPGVIFDLDPMWEPPTNGVGGGNGFAYNPLTNASSNAFFYNGPSVIDFGTNLANLGGQLILTNGGALYMHGIILLSNLTVEGTSLPAGVYTYAQLVSTYNPNNNFTPPAAIYPNQGGILIIQSYGKPVVPAQMVTRPVEDVLYPGRTAIFTATGSGTPPLSYQWSKNSVPLTDGGNILGSATATLTVSGVGASDAATYTVVVSNLYGSAKASAPLLVVDAVQPYEIAVSNLNPVAYYQFDEVTNPALGDVPAFDYAGGFTGTYGTAVQNGFDSVAGPNPTAGFPGFAATNAAIGLGSAASNFVSVPDWNLNTDTVTMIAWVNPQGAENPSAGIIFCRGNDTVAGMNYGNNVDNTTSAYDLGYTWNNDVGTYDWDSGLVPPLGIWSMVSLVVTPTQATIYMMNANGLTESTHVYPHVVQAFDTNNTTLIGEDSNDGGNGTRSFNGFIDEVSIYNTALTGDQIASLFYVATGDSSYAPEIGVEPASTNAYVGETIQLTVGAYGTDPITYQWESAPTGTGIGGPFTPLANGTSYSGVTTPTLTIANLTLAQSQVYVCLVSDPAAPGGYQTQPATVNVQATLPPVFNITMTQQEAAGSDWNTIGNWNDGLGGVPAVVSAIEEPGSFYEVLQGARLRTPAGSTYPVFPGVKLLLDGTGVWINNPGAGTVQGEIRFKPTNPEIGDANVTFPLLVMNGGQLDAGNDGVMVVDGVIDVVSNAIIYSDSADDRGYLLNAQLIGTNSVQYFGDDFSGNSATVSYPAAYSNNLAIAGTNNTFSGPWFIEAGMLLGAASNSLGTNNITIATNAWFQTLYNVKDSNSSLSLSGQMLLTQTDVWRTVFLGGSAALPKGTYSAASLCSNYPAYFPSNWNARAGAPLPTNATGEIIVLFTPGPAISTQPQSVTNYAGQTTTFTVVATGDPPLSYSWSSNGVLLTAGGNVSGSTTATLTLSDTVLADAASYTVVITNTLGGATSQVATLTVLPTGPATNITMSLQEAVGQDWNTTGFWNDGLGGLPASTDVLALPGSTFEVLPGARMRSPGEAIPFTNFPGAQLTIDGDGVYVDLGGPTVGEIRFKQGTSGGICYFPLLIMAGGQLDNGNASTLDVIQGNIDIISNTPIYADDSGSTGLRPYRIDAYLFGNGSVEYHDSDATLGGGLNITCPTNTFTGTWNVVIGALLGSGSNCLGTNSIDVQTNAVLETTYDMHSPGATLSLSNGAVVYLHQNDTFMNVNIGGTNLAAGKYTFAQLNTAYPTTFPASWTPVMTSTFGSGSGSITVIGSGVQIVPIPLDFAFSAGKLTLTWSAGTLLQATNLAGPWVTNTLATSPYVVTPTNSQEYFEILVGP